MREIRPYFGTTLKTEKKEEKVETKKILDEPIKKTKKEEKTEE